MSESSTELPVSVARERFADIINAAAYRDEATYVTRHGKRIAVIVPIRDYEAMREHDRTAKRGTGTAVREMLERHLAEFGPGDDSWARELEELRDVVVDEGSAWDED